tara:strand:- start:2790 stop:4010 length:1221 start_codon:yes stop_codon:yes gene_type:complete
MAKIIPFKAIRPVRDKAHLISSRPYFTYKKSILKAKLESNVFSFLHVINPEFRKGDKTKPNSIERFQAVSDKYIDFKNKNYFKKDEKPCFYFYRQTSSHGVYSGIIAGASVDDYQKNKIKKHENTIISREKLFKKYLDVCNFHAEPVLLTYNRTQKIKEINEEIVKKRPEYEFTNTDQKKHEFWVIQNAETIEKLTKEFDIIDDIYIADGHHRAASSLLYHKDNKKNKLSGFFLSLFIDKKDIKIFEFNRFINNISPLDVKSLLSKLKTDFNISKPTKKHISPRNKKEISLYIDNQWYVIETKEEVLKTLSYKQQLNSQIVSDLILKPILKIKDLRKDKRVEFISGELPIKNITNMVKNTPNSIAFCLFPHDIEEIIKIADNSDTMPPKSTWIEPKLRSAITIYEY